MTSTFRAMLGSSLMAAAIAIAPIAASAQTTTAAPTPKSVKTAEKKVATAKKAEKTAVVAETKAAAKGDTKAVKADEKKVVAAKTAEKKAVKEETKVVAKADMVGCTDGTMSKGGQGACSGHGGIKTTVPAKAVANKLAASPKAAPKAVTKASTKSAVAVTDASNNVAAGATAKCKDGSYSHAKNHTGACSGHGGVATWM
jgi:hypothetical protein